MEVAGPVAITAKRDADAGLPNTPSTATPPSHTGSDSVSNHAVDWASDTIAFIGAFLRRLAPCLVNVPRIAALLAAMGSAA
jgi:hypothetical protein